MQDFQVTENTLAKWKIDKSSHLVIASLIFLIPLAAFVVSFISIYFVMKSTDILLLILPVILFFPLIPTFKEFWLDLSIYKENLEVYLTDNGVYVRHLDKKDKYEFINWANIKQYDVTAFPANSFLGSLVPKPIRFTLRAEVEEEDVVVDVIGEDEVVLREQLKLRDISFGFRQ